MQPNQTELTVEFKTPIVISENSIIFSKKDGTVVLAFLQFNDLKKPAHAHVVSAVELKDLTKLEELHKSIGEHIQKEKVKEN